MGTTQTNTPAVQQQGASPLGTLQSLLEKYKGQISVALPRHMTPERMIRVALTAYSSTPGLQKCTPLSIAGCIVQASILGLEPNSVLGEAYLVPFGNVCQLIPGYMGLIKLVRNSGELQMVNAQPVHQRDEFDFEDGLDPYLKHKRAPGTPEERGPVVAYWAGAVLKGGGRQFVVMTRAEAEGHGKKFSKTFNNGPWKTDFDAMAMKTCIRKLCKFLPKSVEAHTAMALDERNEAGTHQQFSIDVPLELHPPAEEEQPKIEEPRRKSETSEAKPEASPEYEKWGTIPGPEEDFKEGDRILVKGVLHEMGDVSWRPVQ
jgi:recombination protein RecT